MSRRPREKEGEAFEKQVKYLLSLTGRRGISPVQLARQHGAASIGDLDRPGRSKGQDHDQHRLGCHGNHCGH
ncbi:MAG: hypothetical protein MJ025_04075 [Victivallaceae bacterium]|nr:hypothetical protein [Victivallaceae bacterium]